MNIFKNSAKISGIPLKVSVGITETSDHYHYLDTETMSSTKIYDIPIEDS
jgi:hypothetical protein